MRRVQGQTTASRVLALLNLPFRPLRNAQLLANRNAKMDDSSVPSPEAAGLRLSAH